MTLTLTQMGFGLLNFLTLSLTLALVVLVLWQGGRHSRNLVVALNIFSVGLLALVGLMVTVASTGAVIVLPAYPLILLTVISRLIAWSWFAFTLSLIGCTAKTWVRVLLVALAVYFSAELLILLPQGYLIDLTSPIVGLISPVTRLTTLGSLAAWLPRLLILGSLSLLLWQRKRVPVEFLLVNICWIVGFGIATQLPPVLYWLMPIFMGVVTMLLMVRTVLNQQLFFPLAQANQRLETSEANYRAIVDMLADFAYAATVAPDQRVTLDWVTAQVGDFIHMNGMQSFTLEDILHMVHDDDLEKIEAYSERILQGKSDAVEVRVIDESGELRWVRIHTHPIWSEEDQRLTGYYSAAQDVTDLKRAESLVHESRRLESIGLLAGGIAHDFNNLLTGMLTQASLARERLSAETPAYQHVVKLEASAQKASLLTRQLLAFAGKGRFEVATFDLNTAVTETLDLLAGSIEERVTLVRDLDGASLWIEGDQGQIQQIIMNLTLNGAQAMATKGDLVVMSRTLEKPGPLSAESQMVHGKLREQPYACFCVMDKGQGMDADTLSQIFEPFFSTKSDGHGLGLSATLGIVQAHGGVVRVQSDLGRGSMFEVLLPLVDAPATAEPLQPVESDSDSGGVDSAESYVMIVDDEQFVREALVDVLELKEYAVLQANGGRQAIELMQTHGSAVTLVILDVQMPDMNGIETFDALRALCPNVAVLFSSGYSEDETMRRFSHEEGVSFLQKPYTIATLMAAIDGLLIESPVHS